MYEKNSDPQIPGDDDFGDPGDEKALPRGSPGPRGRVLKSFLTKNFKLFFKKFNLFSLNDF